MDTLLKLAVINRNYFRTAGYYLEFRPSDSEPSTIDLRHIFVTYFTLAKSTKEVFSIAGKIWRSTVRYSRMLQPAFIPESAGRPVLDAGCMITVCIRGRLTLSLHIRPLTIYAYAVTR